MPQHVNGVPLLVFPSAGRSRDWFRYTRYLLHGTSPSAARTISESDFKINLAGVSMTHELLISAAALIAAPPLEAPTLELCMVEEPTSLNRSQRRCNWETSRVQRLHAMYCVLASFAGFVWVVAVMMRLMSMQSRIAKGTLLSFFVVCLADMFSTLTRWTQTQRMLLSLQSD
eukprot:2803370-Amphidinium_carterae.1